ncbi:MAG: maleylpyruvate isomerase N-terminal domain-containing protein [Micromonosporaceae bacterium]
MATAEVAPLVQAMSGALADSGASVSAMMRRVSDPARRAIGTWSIGETAQHVAAGPGYFLAAARGEAELVALGNVDADNAQELAKDPQRDPRVLADRFDEGIRALVSYARAVHGDPLVEPFTGVKVPLSCLLAIELDEVLVHGFDIARAAGLAWRIEPAHALLTHEGIMALMPFLLDKERAAGVRMSLELRIRGMASQVLTIGDGVLRVQASAGQPVDCRMSVDPVVYLLLIWNRISPWRPMLRGQLAVWGRQPWLANRLQSLLKL